MGKRVGTVAYLRVMLPQMREAWAANRARWGNAKAFARYGPVSPQEVFDALGYASHEEIWDALDAMQVSGRSFLAEVNECVRGRKLGPTLSWLYVPR